MKYYRVEINFDGFNETEIYYFKEKKLNQIINAADIKVCIKADELSRDDYYEYAIEMAYREYANADSYDPIDYEQSDACRKQYNLLKNQYEGNIEECETDDIYD